MVALRQAALAYPFTKDVMGMPSKEIVLSPIEKKKLNSSLKVAIYKELNKKALLTDWQLTGLVEKETKILK